MFEEYGDGVGFGGVTLCLAEGGNLGREVRPFPHCNGANVMVRVGNGT